MLSERQDKFHRSQIFAGSKDPRDISIHAAISFKETSFLSQLSNNLEAIVNTKLAAIDTGELLSVHSSIDHLESEDINGLKKALTEYYKNFRDYLEYMYSWRDMAFLFQLAAEPFNHSVDGEHVWHIQIDKLHYISQYILEREIPSFIEEIKIAIDEKALPSPWYAGIHEFQFGSDSVLYSTDQLIRAIRRQLSEIDGKLHRAHFLLLLKKHFDSDEDFAWQFDLSSPRRIVKVPRAVNTVYEMMDDELRKLTPQFVVPNAKYKLVRNNREVFQQKWQTLIDSRLIEISSIDKFIDSNFKFDSTAAGESTIYEFAPVKEDNLKLVILEIVQIFDAFGITERTSKREIAFWLFLHFKNLIEYRTIEYYVYHK